MRYIMRAGTLYSQNNMLANIKGALTGPEKKIFSADGRLLLQTNIRNLDTSAGKTGDVRLRQYMLLDADGKEYAVARPDYAEGDDPAVTGWPLCRMPKVDHAQVIMGGNEYRLNMWNSQNYCLEKSTGEKVVQIFHRGLTGGWELEAADEITPEVICGIFVFCRYIEQENEFLAV